MGSKGISQGFPADLSGFPANLLEDALVAQMDSVEVPEGEHRVLEGPPEIFCFPDDIHNLQSAAEPKP
jgi:hypothetical protein